MLITISLLLFPSVLSMKYPNEIEESPTVICEQNQILIKIRTTSSNPSLIYAEDFGDDPECSTRNRNSIELRHGKCGMSQEKTEEPRGAVQRVCITVQLHPLFVTEADRSYCVQCVYVEQHVLNDFEQSLDVSESTATELEPQFDFHVVPKCSYSIRKNSPSGPPAHYAVIGDQVFHVWECEGETHGILVQNCYVEDGQGNRIMIIDNEGCGVDSYVMETPEYSTDLRSAFQQTHVFKFAQKTVTRFACQIRICVKGEDCEDITPPRSCPMTKMSSTIEKVKKEQASHAKIQGVPLSLFEDQPLRPNNTIGSVYFGGDLRTRRHITEELRSSLKKGDSGKPEMEVIGEIRVLESDDDVRYYEHALSLEGGNLACISGLSYTALVSSLTFLSLLLLILLLYLVIRQNQYRKRIHHFST